MLFRSGSSFEIQTALTGTTSMAARLIITGAGDTELFGSIKTAAPTGSTARPYKWGDVASDTLSAHNRLVRVEINGTLYDIFAKAV